MPSGAQWTSGKGFPVSKVDAKVTLPRDSCITHLGYFEKILEESAAAEKLSRSSPWSNTGMSGFLPDAEWGAIDIRKRVPCLQG
jgi:hypothetical protein